MPAPPEQGFGSAQISLMVMLFLSTNTMLDVAHLLLFASGLLAPGISVVCRAGVHLCKLSCHSDLGCCSRLATAGAMLRLQREYSIATGGTELVAYRKEPNNSITPARHSRHSLVSYCSPVLSEPLPIQI